MRAYFKSIPLSLLIAYTFSSSCSQAQSHARDKSVNSVVKDIPLDTKGKPLRFYEKKLELENMIGLDSLENGIDSIEIRIWYGVALSDKLQLLVLKKNISKWSARLYSVQLNYNKNQDSLISVTNSIETKRPVTEWKKLLNSLDNLGMFTLPDAHHIIGYGEGQDGYGVTIEFATKSKYRIYNYPNFNEQKDIKEARQVEQIIRLIEREFNFNRLTIK